MAGIFKTEFSQTGMRDVTPAAITVAPTPKKTISLPLFLAGMPVTLPAQHNAVRRMRILSLEAGW
jgi:hypothetical protein